MKNSDIKRRSRFEEWAEIIERNPLPDWDQLPDLELYMDQVIVLTGRYLSHLEILSGEDKPVTPAMINNYVKMGLMPPPVKKKYRRSQLACIIIICILKRSLTMAAIQKIISKDMTEEDIERLYHSFTRNRSSALDYVTKQIESLDGGIAGTDDADGADDSAMIIRLAVVANLCKFSAEKLAEEAKAEEEDPDDKEKDKKDKKDKGDDD